MGSYDYAGCLSLPRVLYLCGDRLIQVGSEGYTTPLIALILCQGDILSPMYTVNIDYHDCCCNERL